MACKLRPATHQFGYFRTAT